MKVSIAMVTYNHENFIAQAIESTLIQKFNFDYEVVIGEDCSTDSTREKVIDFKIKYPNKIRLLLNEKNLGGRRNFVQTLEACRGRYIALLEGDDYWTSPHKLQKQVDFLDSHPECALCFHNVMVIYDHRPEVSHPYYVQKPNGPFMQATPKPVSTLEDLIEGNFIQTPSVMFRARLFDEFPDWFYKVPLGDWALHMLNAQYGNIRYIDEVMGIYRVHRGGIWSSKGLIQKLEAQIKVYRFIRTYFNFPYDILIKSRLSLFYLLLAEAYKRCGDRSKALANLLKYVSSFPSNQRVSYRRLFLMIVELSSPRFYKILKCFMHRYLK